MFAKSEIYTRRMFKCLSKVTKRLHFYFFQRTFLLRLVHAFLWWKANIQIKEKIIKNFFKNLDWTFVFIVCPKKILYAKFGGVSQAATCTADHNDRVLLTLDLRLRYSFTLPARSFSPRIYSTTDNAGRSKIFQGQMLHSGIITWRLQTFFLGVGYSKVLDTMAAEEKISFI